MKHALAPGVAISTFIFDAMDSSTFVTTNTVGLAWTAIAFPPYAISVAHANDIVDAADYVMVSGGLPLLYGPNTIAGPFSSSGRWTRNPRRATSCS